MGSLAIGNGFIVLGFVLLVWFGKWLRKCNIPTIPVNQNPARCRCSCGVLMRLVYEGSVAHYECHGCGKSGTAVIARLVK